MRQMNKDWGCGRSKGKNMLKRANKDYERQGGDNKKIGRNEEDKLRNKGRNEREANGMKVGKKINKCTEKR
jgi:hypothetical protein